MTLGAVLAYGGFALIVLVLNLVPAFAPPTWAVIVLFRVNSHLNGVALVLLGTASAATGRAGLALAARRWRPHLSAKRIDRFEGARDRLMQSRAGAAAGLALFLLSPVPSGQLFVAAGLLDLALLPLLAAFVAGRLVSNTIYVSGATLARDTNVGTLVTRSLTNPAGIAVQVAFLGVLVALSRVDWRARHGSRR